MKSIKKILLLVLVLLGTITLVSCKKDEPIIEEPIIEEPIVEEPIVEEPEEEEEEEEVPPVVEDYTKEIFGEHKKDTWETVVLNVEGYSSIIISINEKSKYDVPVNIDYFVIDGVSVEFEGVSGTSYLHNHEFQIGNLKAIGHNINTHSDNLRLHSHRSNMRVEHYIKIDLQDNKTFEFQYKITTNAHAYIEALRIQFIV